MAAERVRVCLMFGDVRQFYIRETEVNKGGQWVAQPFIDVHINQAATMSEDVGRGMVNRFRSLGVKDAWLEDARDGRRIDVQPEVAPNSGEDTRKPVAATLNDIDWFIVRPANTPQGAKYFAKARVPGRADYEVIYSDSPLEVLERAKDLGWLDFCERIAAPAAANPQQTENRYLQTPRLRPGDRRA